MTEIERDPANPILAEVWRGDFLESTHRGTAVVCRADGEIIEAFGDPARIILPRSACKMLQALPMVESGAADRAKLPPRLLALSCASHQGMALHTNAVSAWLGELGLGEPDLRCGAHAPYDTPRRIEMRQAGEAPSQLHNNCSGKHAGFLTLNQHLGGGSEYVDLDHPVQTAAKAATEDLAEETSPGHAIDGCSAPNFALSIHGLARAMAAFASAETALTGARASAAARLRDAMRAHPEMIAGPGHLTTRLVEASTGGTVVKSGAEGVYTAILPERGLGIALKIDDGDGADRGRAAAITALLARHGALDPTHPIVAETTDAPIFNVRGVAHGHIRAGAVLRG